MGQIVTFYSYKGGVGRTMALANVAVLLARWGYKTLIVDWDLEAPGLEFFFKEYLDTETTAQAKGVVDLLHSVSAEAVSSPQTLDWQHLVVSVQPPECEQPLHLLTAGARGDGYFGRVRDFDVGSFYAEKQGGLFIESLRDEWKRKYNFVLLDSRTGVTDIGGICTIQLPDLLVMLFTATEQGFEGIVQIARTAAEQRQRLPVDRLKLISVPLPTRFDTQVEFQISQQWLDRFAEKLSDIYADWLPKGVNARKLIEATKIPYIPYFSFGEKLAVVEQGTTDPTGLGYAYETLAALIANNLESVEQVLDNRAEFVRAASRSVSPASDGEAAGEPVTTETFKWEWLGEHVAWLESEGRRGRRLGLARAILRGIDLSGKELRKADLAEADLAEADLTNANLCQAVLTGAKLKEAQLWRCNLKEANLQIANLSSAYLGDAVLTDAKVNDADLRSANLSGAALTDAKLKNSNLAETNFYRAVLRRVSFEGCDIRRASFREADLQDADLSEHEGLMAAQLAGANLSGAKLYSTARLDESVAEVNGKAWLYRITYAALLLACAYALWAGIDYWSSGTAWVSAPSDSPAEQAAEAALRSAAFKGFFIIPAALLGYFLYFQLSLQRVWAALNALPDVFPDGKTLDRKIQPGFIANIVHLYLRQATDEPQTFRFQSRVVVLCVWFAVPLTLFLLCLEAAIVRPRLASVGLETYSIFLLILGLISFLISLVFWRPARRLLRRDAPVKKRTLLRRILFPFAKS